MPTTTESQPSVNDISLAGARAWFAHHRLTRPREGRLLAGVVASFARRYDVNPLVARLVGLVTILTLTPLVYLGAWILMPPDSQDVLR